MMVPEFEPVTDTNASGRVKGFVGPEKTTAHSGRMIADEAIDKSKEA
jgi:hypothetical protein